MNIVDRVTFQQQLLKHSSFPPAGTSVSCAVSGGADSLALMVLAIAAGCDVTAFHVDHGIRDGSESEAEVVRQAAIRFGAEFVGLQVKVDVGPNLEARARAARYSVLPPGVLTGHTADDQAETVLLNLLRGSGSDGLAGMKRETRPILSLRRSETHQLCNELKLNPVQDPSNADPAFLRNRVRAELMPLVNEIASRDVVPVLCRQSDLLLDEVSYLDSIADSLDPTDAKALAAAPLPLARRAVRSWLRVEMGFEQHPPSMASVERVLEVARGHAVACEVEGGLRVARTNQRLRLANS